MKTVKILNNIRNIAPVYVGDDYPPTIIASIGVSNPGDTIQKEIEKALSAIESGAQIITDHSLRENIDEIHKEMIEKINVPFSTVSIYESAVYFKKYNTITSELILKQYENQVKRGIDMLTIHATVFLEDLKLLKNSKRIIPCTSRGGTMMLEIMEKMNFNNPYWENFDRLLQIAKRYNVTISLGIGYRPASVCDSEIDEPLYFMEMKRMACLVEKAKNMGVGIIVEGIGHTPINKIPYIIKKSKEICHYVPYRILTVATDIALGYDHISSAIANAVAVYNGANMITCVSRSEHIGLPTKEDLIEAVITARISAYCGFSARKNDFSRDKCMSEARTGIGCHGQIEEAIYPKGAKEALLKHKIIKDKKECSMCGEFCALNTSDRIINK